MRTIENVIFLAFLDVPLSEVLVLMTMSIKFHRIFQKGIVTAHEIIQIILSLKLLNILSEIKRKTLALAVSPLPDED